MQRALLPVLILVAVVIAAALAWFTLTRGSARTGEVVTEERVVNPFRRLDLNGHLDVTLVQGPRESVTVETPSSNQPRVRAAVDGSTLTVSGGDARRWWQALFGTRTSSTPRVTVTFKNLDAVTMSGAIKLSANRVDSDQLRIAASGGSSVRIDDLRAQNVRVAGSGALKATLAGRVVDEDISISGAGDVRAERLQADNAKVSVSGAGKIVVSPRKTLRASISGAGSVEYYGDPDVRESTSGVGRIKRREAMVP